MLDEDDKPDNAKSGLDSEIDGDDCSVRSGAADRGMRSASQTSDCSAKSDDTGCGSKGTLETSDTEAEGPHAQSRTHHDSVEAARQTPPFRDCTSGREARGSPAAATAIGEPSGRDLGAGKVQGGERN